MEKFLLVLGALLLLNACNSPGNPMGESQEAAVSASAQKAASAKLAGVLAAQPAETRERYRYRNPAETMAFFGIQPGSTVLEALPGGGWYSKILIDYLGPDGQLIGADYAAGMWPLFGFFPPEFIEEKKTWPTDWPADAEAWRTEKSAPISAFIFGSMPPSLAGTADAVLFIRAMHNLSRFEDQGGFRSAALQDAYQILKPGGILGVVQHQAPDSMSDEWADGSHGYLKKGLLIGQIEAAGFEYVGSTDINENPADQPGIDDVVWRLPPTYFTSRENPELRARMEAIGESNRMTLKFMKP
ncbi:MAG: class I SAM-dependent methyltransferase [Gammaproteobacteria bacterium]|nr:class I SAM-dependent methyltransferase [Gammaproteobacteria bacterium]